MQYILVSQGAQSKKPLTFFVWHVIRKTLLESDSFPNTYWYGFLKFISKSLKAVNYKR